MGHRDILKNTELFVEMTDAELTAVEKCVSEMSMPAGTVVIVEGEPEEMLYLIRSGRVRVMRNLGSEEVVLAELGEGKAFGEMSLLDDFPPSATVRTVDDCVFLTIGRLDLNVLLNWDTVLAAKMWRSFTRMLCGRLRDSNERILETMATGAAVDHNALKVTLAASQGGKKVD